jgi:PAS domain-containing protein
LVEAALSEPNAVPLIVLSAARDPVEAVNSTLRRAGHPVHCTWIPALRDLGDALSQINPELLLQVAGTPAELGPVIGLRDQLAPQVPVLLLAPSVDEALIAAAIERGARDAVTLGNQARLSAVVLRELAVFRAARALDATQKSAHDARSQLDNVLQRSNDAILQVQEGIVIEANRAWHELYGV